MSDLTVKKLLVSTSPLTHTGIYYLGPLFVKISRKNIKQSNFKTI